MPKARLSEEHSNGVSAGAQGPVLLVEDEEDIGDIIDSMLSGIGYAPVYRATTVDEALSLLHTARIEAAVLDVLLRGSPAHQVAQQLRDRRIPFVVSTAYDTETLPNSFRSGVPLRKPYAAFDLMEALATATKRTRD